MTEPTRRCFHCGAIPVTHSFESQLTPSHFGEWVEWVRRGSPEERTPVTVTIYTCAAHEDAVSGLLLERLDIASGYDLRPRSCPDAWHEQEDGGVECPTCGFRTVSRDPWRDMSGDTAYQDLAHAFDILAGVSGPPPGP